MGTLTCALSFAVVRVAVETPGVKFGTSCTEPKLEVVVVSVQITYAS